MRLGSISTNSAVDRRPVFFRGDSVRRVGKMKLDGFIVFRLYSGGYFLVNAVLSGILGAAEPPNFQEF